jgi:NADH-quinone oxidoreductase subunit D
MSVELIKDGEKINSELMTVNMGPQHPATHGVLRVEIETDSEIVAKATPHIGYLHRCMEKHCEAVDYRAIVPFVDRMDYISGMNNELGYVLGVEKLMGLEIPERAQNIRVLVAELQRLASHLLFFGVYAIDLGAFTPFLYAFDHRERILEIFESLSGARLLFNYVWIGGVWNDITADEIRLIKKFIANLEPDLDLYETLLTQNKIFKERTAHVGIIDKEMAHRYGATGAVLRGAGVKWDLRKNKPYSGYEKYDFDVPVGQGLVGELGDCWDRYYVRMQEMRQSIRIIKQVIDGIAEGEHMAKVPKVIKLPKGEVYMRTENPRGELGFHIVSDGKKTPLRVKVKSPCFTHTSMLSEIGEGQMIADFVASIGSIDIVLGEVDR